MAGAKPTLAQQMIAVSRAARKLSKEQPLLGAVRKIAHRKTK